MKSITLTRHIPEGFKKLADNSLFQVYRDPEKPIAIAYIGKRRKAEWYLRFHSEETLKAKIEALAKSLMAWEETKSKRKEERKQEVLEVKVGDLFYSSWGYDQTNIDFYQVIAVKGKTFTTRRIRQLTVEGSEGFMSANVKPARDSFMDGEPITHRSFKLNSYSWLSKTTDEQAHYCSWYA